MSSRVEYQKDIYQIRIKQIVVLLYQKRRFIILSCALVVLFASIYIFSLPRSYTSRVVLLPELSSSTGISGSLGSLASFAGIKLGNSGGDDAISPEFYPKVLSSTPFVVEMFAVQVSLNTGVKVSLYDYFDRYQKEPWWSSIFSFFKSQKTEEMKQIDAYRFTKHQDLVAKHMLKAIVCMVDKKTDMITIEVSVQDPEIAAYVANILKEKLQEYIIDYRTSKARIDAEYMEKIVQETKDQYLAAQMAYATYSDAHQDLYLMKFNQEKTRLENEMQLAYTVYSQAKQQLQLSQAKLQERTPVFVTIQPGTVPLKPSAPKRMIFIFMVSILTVVLSSVCLIVKDIYNRK